MTLLEHSDATLLFMRTYTAKNSLYKGKSSLFCFCQFLAYKDQFWASHYNASENIIFEAARKALLKNNLSVTGYLPSRHSTWSEEQCVRLRYWPIVFVCNYISKRTNKEVCPLTMRTHI